MINGDVQSLYFDIYFSFVQLVADTPVNGDKQQGKGKGTGGFTENGHEDYII